MQRRKNAARKKFARVSLACSIFLSVACASAAEPEQTNDAAGDARHLSGKLIAYTTPVGAVEVNAARIKPYHARWESPQGIFEEKLTAADESAWRHEQVTIRLADGAKTKVSTETRLLGRDDLRSLAWSRAFHIDSPNLPFKTAGVESNRNGYEGEMTTLDGEQAPFNADLPMPVFDGWIAGLVIASLPLEEGYWASLPTATHLFKGIHHLTVRVVERGPFETPQGEAIDAFEVEATWVDLANGDIYEPGAEGAGGVYHIAVEPGDGVPFVLKYEAQSNPIAWDGVRLAAPE